MERAVGLCGARAGLFGWASCREPPYTHTIGFIGL